MRRLERSRWDAPQTHEPKPSFDCAVPSGCRLIKSIKHHKPMNFQNQADLEQELAETKRQLANTKQLLATTESELQRYKDRLDDLGEELKEEDEDEELETVDRLENLQMAQHLLDLPATELGVIERAHCELWLDTSFEPTVGQVEYLETLYSACEREANSELTDT